MVADTIGPMVLDDAEKTRLALQLVAQAREAGIDLGGPDGLLTGLTKQVLETASEEELTEHLGCEPGDREGKGRQAGDNERNGSRTQTVITEIGPMQIDVPRYRDGKFEPGIVKKRQRRLDGVDELVLSLTARV